MAPLQKPNADNTLPKDSTLGPQAHSNSPLKSSTIPAIYKLSQSQAIPMTTLNHGVIHSNVTPITATNTNDPPFAILNHRYILSHAACTPSATMARTKRQVKMAKVQAATLAASQQRVMKRQADMLAGRAAKKAKQDREEQESREIEDRALTEEQKAENLATWDVDPEYLEGWKKLKAQRAAEAAAEAEAQKAKEVKSEAEEGKEVKSEAEEGKEVADNGGEQKGGEEKTIVEKEAVEKAAAEKHETDKFAPIGLEELCKIKRGPLDSADYVWE